MLEVKSLNYAYKEKEVLKKIAFKAEKGKITVILGPNGAGKTTLLKCLNRILTPAAGEVFIDEKAVGRMHVREIARNMAYVAQTPEGGRITVFDAVLMGRIPHLGFRPGPSDLKKTHAVMKQLHLTDMALKTLDRLSGGERQKVSIARALAQETPILLMDEPTASLDLKNQTDILSLVRRIARDHNIAVIMTMHDLNAALRYADQYICLKDKKIFGTGEVKTITPELIGAVYGVPVDLIRHNGQPMVAPCARAAFKETAA